MIETALNRVYGNAAPGTALANIRRKRADILIVASAFALAFGVMPFVYAATVIDLDFREALSGESFKHIILASALNAIIMIWATRFSGRFDRKLASLLTRILLVHGVAAYWILVFRATYSNQIILSGVVFSALLGSLVLLVRQKVVETRLALLGSWHPLMESLRAPCVHVQDPTTDLTSYDMLLTSSVEDLSSEWASCLSRAMLMGKSVRLLAEYVEEDQGIVSIDHFDLEHLPSAGLTSYRTRKRFMDISLVILSLPVTVPLLLVGIIAILTTMSGPVFFVQTRVGLGGRVFRMFKLRTMLVNAPAAERATMEKHDARITRTGRWLRRFRIDELPQLWNVLVGDMSVIGPRPEWTVLSEGYVAQLPVYAYRHLVRPGITGWAQVKGGYAADLAETRAKVGYDLFYIKNLSFSLDLQILARTIWTLLSGSGAR